MSGRLQNVFVWVSTFPIYSAGEPKFEDFKDGVILSRILKDSIDPIYFSDLDSSAANPYTHLNTFIDKMKRYCAAKVI